MLSNDSIIYHAGRWCRREKKKAGLTMRCNKRQTKKITWIDPRESTPPFNKIVMLFFGEDKNVYFGFYTNGGTWRVLNGCYVGAEKYDVTSLMCMPNYWAYLPQVPNY